MKQSILNKRKGLVEKVMLLGCVGWMLFGVMIANPASHHTEKVKLVFATAASICTILSTLYYLGLKKKEAIYAPVAALMGFTGGYYHEIFM